MIFFQNRTFLLCITIIFFSIQILCTITNKNRYPFCTYNMFSKTYNGKYAQYEVYLTNTTKHKSFLCPAYKIIPIEFFRVNSVMDNIYNYDNKEQQEQLSKIILNTLNKTSWYHFDEIYSSPKSDFFFDKIDISICEYSFHGINDVSKDCSIIYSYQLK